MVDAGEPSALASADGRVRRGARNRQAMVEAFLRLVEGGNLRVTGVQVAEEAGVSVRSLWTHFADLEALYAAAAAALWQRHLDTHAAVATTGSLDDRLDEWCRQRSTELEELSPYAAAAALREPFSAALRDSREQFLDALRRDVEAVFAAELDAAGPDSLGSLGAGGRAAGREARREARRDALVAVASYRCWSVWRDDLGLPVDAARAALRAATRGLLTGR